MSRITSRGATGPLALHASGAFQVSADANLATLVGTRWDLSDGREVTLVSNGATAISTAGNLVQDAAVVPNHQNMAIGQIVAYSNNGNIPYSFNATVGATAAQANQYAGGLAIVNAGAGIGQTLRIASNAACAGSASMAVVLEDAPNVALVAGSSKVSLTPPHGANVILFPSTPTGAAVGITLYPVSAGQGAGLTAGTPSYAFVTSKGLTSAQSDASAPVVGAQLMPSVTTAGMLGASTGTGVAIIGYASQASVSQEARTVFVNL